MSHRLLLLALTTALLLDNRNKKIILPQLLGTKVIKTSRLIAGQINLVLEKL